MLLQREKNTLIRLQYLHKFFFFKNNSIYALKDEYDFSHEE